MEITAGPGMTPAPTGGEARVAGRRIDWTGRDAAFGMLAFAGIFILLPLPPQVVALIFFDIDSAAFWGIALAMSAVVFVALVFTAARFTFGKYGGSWGRLGFGPVRWSTIGWAVAGLAGALAISMSYNVAVEAFDIGALKQSCDDQVPGQVRDSRVLMTMMVVLVLGFAPIAEETFFRGFIFPGIARAWGFVPGIVVSGLLFGSAHVLGNPELYKSLAVFAAIGMVFAFVYARSGNLLSNVLAHLAFNTIGTVAMLVTTCEP